jgi:hypothetical protein
MSADNGVYILVNRGRKTQRGHKKEYRVIHAQAIENISFMPDYPLGEEERLLNREQVLSYFGEARVFTDRKLAEAYAQGVHDVWIHFFGCVEYGIVWFDDFAHIRFPKPEQPQPVKRSQLSAAR